MWSIGQLLATRVLNDNNFKEWDKQRNGLKFNVVLTVHRR